MNAHLFVTRYAAPLSDSTARALISRVTVVTGRDSAFAIAYTVLPEFSIDSMRSRSSPVNLGFFIA